MCLVAVLLWGNAVFLFKYILKIRLAGKAQIIADFNQAFIGMGQKAFRLFQFASHNKAADIKSQFLFKTPGEVGTASPDMLRYICDLDWFIDMVGNILDTVKYFPRHSLWNLGL